MPSGTSTESLDQVLEQFVARCRSGSDPPVAEYVARYPQHAEQLSAMLPCVAMVERLSHRELAAVEAEQRLAAVRSDPPQWIGDHRIVREIGAGGMGVVYEAIQQSLGRRVAIKVLTASAVRSPKRLERFRHEARAAAKLHHTSIVPVFGIGEDDGRHYYVMQYIEGQTLEQHLEQLRLEHREGLAGNAVVPSPSAAPFGRWEHVAHIGIQVARAAAYAHGHGILHRDIKPANLLIDPCGSVWVADFGLARLIDDDRLTRSGDVVGTLGYMAPEQLDGHASIAGDIYGIGVTLYELATLRPAHTMASLGRKGGGGPLGPVPPRRIDASLPRDLETIILKAIAHEPAGRYRSAGELADDLQRFACGEPICARRASVPERVWRWFRRNPAIATLSSLSILLLALVAAVALVGLQRVDQERRRVVEFALRQQQLAEQSRQSTEQAELEGRRARKEFARAEENLRLAMRALGNVVERIAEKGTAPDGDPTSRESAPAAPTGADAELLESLLGLYVELADRNGTDRIVQIETAEAYYLIGGIRERLGQYDQALAALEASWQLYHQYDGGERSDHLIARTRVINRLGVVQARLGRIGEAIGSHRLALDRLLFDADDQQASNDRRFAVAETYNHLCALFPANRMARPEFTRGRGPRRGPGGPPPMSGPPWMSRHHAEALRILEELVAEDPGNDLYRLALARCCRYSLASVRRDGSDEAARQLARAIEILEQLVARHPENMVYRFELAGALSTDHSLLAGTEFGQTLVSRLPRAASLARQLVRQSPGDPEFELLMYRMLVAMGAMYQSQSRYFDAGACFTEVVAALERQAEVAQLSAPLAEIYQRALAATGDGAPRSRFGPARLLAE